MVWDPDPVMIVLGPVAIHWYGFFFTLGLLATVWFGHRLFAQRGLAERDASNLTFATLAGLFLGAHLFYVLFYAWDQFLENPAMLLDPRAGLASHGGAFGVVVAVLTYARVKRIQFHRLADAIVLAAMWLVPTVRMGNFFNSEIVGRATDLPWGVVFVQSGHLQPRHPSQLYEVVLGLGMLGLGAWLHARRDRLRVGATFYLMLTIYFVVRFLLEFFKEFQMESRALGLTMGQMLSLPGALVCGGALWLMRPISRGPDQSTTENGSRPTS